MAEGILNPSFVEHRYSHTTHVVLSSSSLCRYCIAYVYGPLLRRDLEEFVLMWNTHRMRHNRNAYCPPGVPDDLYYFPEHNGKFSVHVYIIHVSICIYQHVDVLLLLFPAQVQRIIYRYLLTVTRSQKQQGSTI